MEPGAQLLRGLQQCPVSFWLAAVLSLPWLVPPTPPPSLKCLLKPLFSLGLPPVLSGLPSQESCHTLPWHFLFQHRAVRKLLSDLVFAGLPRVAGTYLSRAVRKEAGMLRCADILSAFEESPALVADVIDTRAVYTPWE